MGSGRSANPEPGSVLASLHGPYLSILQGRMRAKFLTLRYFILPRVRSKFSANKKNPVSVRYHAQRTTHQKTREAGWRNTLFAGKLWSPVEKSASQNCTHCLQD